AHVSYIVFVFIRHILLSTTCYSTLSLHDALPIWFSYLESFPLRSPFFGRATEIGLRRGAKKYLLPERARSFMIPPRRRTTRSVKSSPGGHSPAKSSTAASVENRAWFALAPLTAPAAAERRSIPNSSSPEFRHSVTPSEKAINMSPGFSRTFPEWNSALGSAPSIGPPISSRSTAVSCLISSGAGSPALQYASSFPC